MAKKVPATNQDREKSYFKYYMEDCSLGDPEKYAKITPEPYDNALALRIQDRNDLFKPGDLPCPFGWWQLEDGTALIANRTLFPGVNGEIFAETPF